MTDPLCLSPRARRFLDLVQRLLAQIAADAAVSTQDHLVCVSAMRRHCVRGVFTHQPMPPTCWPHYDQFLELTTLIRERGGLDAQDLERLETLIEETAALQVDRVGAQLGTDALSDRTTRAPLYCSRDVTSGD